MNNNKELMSSEELKQNISDVVGEIVTAEEKNLKQKNGLHNFINKNNVNLSVNGISMTNEMNELHKNLTCDRELGKDNDITQCPYMKSFVNNNDVEANKLENENEILEKFSSELAESLLKSNEIQNTIYNNSDQNLPVNNDDPLKSMSVKGYSVGQCHSIASLSPDISRQNSFKTLLNSESNAKINASDNVDSEIVAEHLGITYVKYKDESQMPEIMRLITKDLSEPYSIYTYRYFIHNWPHLCFLAKSDAEFVGAIVCKLDMHKKISRRGYIAMLAVDKSVRRKRIGTTLVKTAIEAMDRDGCDEVVLETEVSNQPALHLYENLGFVRDKRLFRYYLNGVDALRLKLWLR